MAAGAELYIVATGTTILLIAVQCLFHLRCRLFQTKKYFRIKITFESEGAEGERIKELFQAERFNKLVIERKEDKVLFHATLNTDKEYSSVQLNEIMERHSFIYSIERCEED